MTLSVNASKMILPLTPIQEISPAAGRLRLAAGVVLEVLVLKHQGDGKVTLQVKNTSMVAETLARLNPGDKLMIRVEQTAPQVVLRILGGTQTQKLTEWLCLQRVSPGVLSDLFSGAKNLVNPALIEMHAGQPAAKNAQLLLQALDACIFSLKAVDDPLFLKEVMSRIGLPLERNLLKGQSKSDHGESVKEILLKLVSEIQEAGGADHLKETLAFLQRGIGAIEGQQIAAVLGQELDHSLFLQVFFQFPAGIRMQDIFIDRNADGPDGRPRFHCVLLLSMDGLGEIIADASVYGSRLDCILYAESLDAIDFMDILLPELRDRLAAAGYSEVFVRCAVQRRIQDMKSDLIAQKKLFRMHAVDVQI